MTIPNPARALGFNWFAGENASGGGVLMPILTHSVFVSDVVPAPVNLSDGSGLLAPLAFSSSMPRQVYIVRVRITTDGDRTVGGQGEIDVWIDRAGRWFHTGNPHGSESGIAIDNQTLAFSYVYGAPFNALWGLQYPALVDRDAGDLLVVDFIAGQNYSWLNVEFDYLVQG